jgi:rhodanese-related sulfurtransferase
MLRSVPVREITVEELHDLLESGGSPLLLDVRSYGEHDLAHLPGSLLIPLPELAERVDEVERGRPIVAYCHHGIRSRSAAALLSGAGFADVVSLRGGIDAWSLRVDPALARY